MEKEEAEKLIEELRGRFDAPFNSDDKSTIEKLYNAVLGKQFKPTTCQTCYHDALIEVYHHLKKNGQMASKLNYRLKAGAIINTPSFKNGKIFTNDNLTDAIAKEYLKKFPQRIDIFQKLPKDAKSSKAVKDEEPEPEEAETMVEGSEPEEAEDESEDEPTE